MVSGREKRRREEDRSARAPWKKRMSARQIGNLKHPGIDQKKERPDFDLKVANKRETLHLNESNEKGPVADLPERTTLKKRRGMVLQNQAMGQKEKEPKGKTNWKVNPSQGGEKNRYVASS